MGDKIEAEVKKPKPAEGRGGREGQKRAAPQSFASYLARKYVDELDGLRAISVLLVISVHMADQHLWHWLGGGQGVTIFFVLSGYLITMLALREERQNGAVSLRGFYIRRTCRIFPLYYVVLLLLCVLIFCAGWGQQLRENFVDALPSYLLYFQEIHFAGDVTAGRQSPFSHSWSLGIEEKFYLVWPFLAFVIWRNRPASRVRAALLLILFFATMRSAGRVSEALASLRVDIILFPYSQILLGCLLALLLENETWYARLRVLGTGPWNYLVLLVFLTLQFGYAPIVPSLPEIQIPYTLAVGCLVASVLTGQGWLQAVLRCRPMVFVGRLSYGMYLIHGLGISSAQRLLRPGSGRVEVSVLAFFLACAFTILAAYVLAVVIERPWIRLGRRWSQRVMEKKALGLKAGLEPAH
jgi:peptidoglycan/LPS O-acetylase OafA/YrhL